MGKLESKKLRASQLLRRVLEAPDLVATVRALPPERLGALVHEVGLEDAGELVALATTEQLESLFDDDLWTSGGDAEERFDASRFALWLEVLFEAGEAVVVRRLLELPREFVCFAVVQLAYVLDLDALQEDVEMDDRYHARVERALEAAASEEWEEFRLVDRGIGGFDVLVSGLLALDTEHSSVLRVILERCCDLSVAEMDDRGGLVKALSRLEAAEESARGERQERRTERGYVSLADARSFLKLAASGLEYESVRDPISHAYFRDVYGAKRAQTDRTAAAEVAKPPRRLVDALGAPLTARELDAPMVRLSEALEALQQRDAVSYERRVSELAYLANVLVAASEPAPRKLRPIEASETALCVCALGLAELGFRDSSASELSLALDNLLFDVAFRAGFRHFARDETQSPLLRSVLLAVVANVLESGRPRK